MPASELCEVVITAPDPEWLRDFSRQLVEDGLCASAHNFAPVRSIYRWRGKIYERTEGRASLHTRHSRVQEIVDRANKDHPYEVPGISIPERTMTRLERAGDQAAQEGIRIAVELIDQIKPWAQGVYLMPQFNRFDLVAEIIEQGRS